MKKIKVWPLFEISRLWNIKRSDGGFLCEQHTLQNTSTWIKWIKMCWSFVEKLRVSIKDLDNVMLQSTNMFVQFSFANKTSISVPPPKWKCLFIVSIYPKCRALFLVFLTRETVFQSVITTASRLVMFEIVCPACPSCQWDLLIWQGEFVPRKLKKKVMNLINETRFDENERPPTTQECELSTVARYEWKIN